MDIANDGSELFQTVGLATEKVRLANVLGQTHGTEDN